VCHDNVTLPAWPGTRNCLRLRQHGLNPMHLVQCLFLLSPPFPCVAYSCAVVDKKDHTTGAIQVSTDNSVLRVYVNPGVPELYVQDRYLPSYLFRTCMERSLDRLMEVPSLILLYKPPWLLLVHGIRTYGSICEKWTILRFCGSSLSCKVFYTYSLSISKPLFPKIYPA
jgi:hypothetical protein